MNSRSCMRRRQSRVEYANAVLLLVAIILCLPWGLEGSSRLQRAPEPPAELSSVIGGPLRCIDDDYVELSVVLEKDIRAGRPTEPDIMQALEAACREVGGCLQAEVDQVKSFVGRYWEDEYERQSRDALAKGSRVLSSRFKYTVDRSVTVVYSSKFASDPQHAQTRIRLSPSGDVDSSVGLFCHQHGLEPTHPACLEAAYYVRVARQGQPWCVHHKETVTSFTRRLLLDPQAPATSPFTDLVRAARLPVTPHSLAAWQRGSGTLVVAGGEQESGEVMAEARWRASLDPPPGQADCYGATLPLRIELGWDEGAGVSHGARLGVGDVAALLDGPVLVAYRMSGCDWTILPVHADSLIINASCASRPLHHDDVAGRRLLAVQLFESLRHSPISRMMVVSARQCRPPPPELRATPALPPSGSSKEEVEDAAVASRVLAALLAHDRGQEVVSSFADVYAGFEGRDAMDGVALPLRFFHDTDRHLLHLQACEGLSLAEELGVDAFLTCMLQMPARVDFHRRQRLGHDGPHVPEPLGLRSAIVQVSRLEQVLSEVLVEEGRRGEGWSWPRFSRLRTRLEELLLPSWHVLANTTNTDKLSYHGYHRFYAPAFEPYRRRGMRMMELGSKESSVVFWPRVFAEGNLTFIDILFKETCLPCRLGDGALGYHVDLHDEHEVAALAERFAVERMDVIIDDASHSPEAQVMAFRHLFDRALKPGGLYVIEDVETSYADAYSDLSIYPHFTSLIHIINREYIDPLLDYGELAPAASLVSSVTFGHNCILLRKKDGTDEPFEGRLYRSRHLMANYTIGGMSEHEAVRALHIEKGQVEPLPAATSAKVDWSRMWERLMAMTSSRGGPAVL